MEVAVLTVGDEVLAGDTVNTNATWLAGRLTDSGAAVARILTVPDDRQLIAEHVREWAAHLTETVARLCSTVDSTDPANRSALAIVLFTR